MTAIDDLSVSISADTSSFSNSLTALGRQADSFASAITGAFKSAVSGGKDFDSVLSGLALKLAGIALDSALKPIGNAFAGLFSAFGLADGGVVAGGAIKPFAQGGVFNSPTVFPLARGLGLLGEAGAEAVMPLARGSDGKLGVRSDGGGQAVTVNFNISSPDADSFRKSETQVTAMLARAVGRGRRGL